MTRRFKRPDYEATRQTNLQLSEALAPNPLAQFVVDVIAQFLLVVTLPGTYLDAVVLCCHSECAPVCPG